MREDQKIFDECMPTLPRADDTEVATANAHSETPVATPAPVVDLSGMRLLADMASAIHHVEPDNRDDVLRDILTACSILDGIDSMRNRGVAITIAEDGRWIISFINAPTLGPVILDPISGTVEMVSGATDGETTN